jgi:alpha-1,3-glucan synthase
LTGVFNDQVWLLYTNENVTKTFTFDCKSQGWISTPFESGTVVQNLFAPYETYTLTDSLSSFFNNSQPPWQGCLPSVTMDPLGFKALVPVAQWVPPLPALTKFTPGHDARIHAEAGDANATSLDISFEFNVAMSCTSVTNSMTFNMSSSGIGGNPTVLQSSIVCANVTNPDPSPVSGVSISQWSWSATLQNVPDGILSIQLNNPAAAVGNASTGAVDKVLVRKGSSSNVMIFPNNDYNSSSFGFSNGQYTFTHAAFGADMFRYSWNFGMNWTAWANWESVTNIPPSQFDGTFWQGQHIMVQCELVLALFSS